MIADTSSPHSSESFEKFCAGSFALSFARNGSMIGATASVSASFCWSTSRSTLAPVTIFVMLPHTKPSAGATARPPVLSTAPAVEATMTARPLPRNATEMAQSYFLESCATIGSIAALMSAAGSRGAAYAGAVSSTESIRAAAAEPPIATIATKIVSSLAAKFADDGVQEARRAAARPAGDAAHVRGAGAHGAAVDARLLPGVLRLRGADGVYAATLSKGSRVRRASRRSATCSRRVVLARACRGASRGFR